MNLVRFAHNWNIGIMEQWNVGLLFILLKNINIHEINQSWKEKISILIESLQRKQKDQVWEDNFQTK